MKRKLTALVLALVVLAGLLPQLPAEAEAASDSLKNAIATQFDAYAAKIAQSNSADDCVDSLLYPALFGDGSAKTFSESSAVTAAIYNSKLFREYVVKCLPEVIDFMQSQYQRSTLSGGSLDWHDYAMQYNMMIFDYNETADTSDDVNYVALVSKTQYSGSQNKNDQALTLVAGGTNCRFLIKQTWASKTQIGYRVSVTVSDKFDFSLNYSDADKQGFDTTYTKMLNLVGKFLRLKNFSWKSVSAFDITVPNSCTHANGNHRWENIGGELEAVSGEGLTDNPTSKIPFTAYDGSARHYYRLNDTVVLLHNQPWTLEICMKGGSNFAMSATDHYSSTYNPAILKLWNGIYGIENEPYYKWVDGEGRYTYHKRHQHGIRYTDYGVSNTDNMVLLLENRIAENGSNLSAGQRQRLSLVRAVLRKPKLLIMDEVTSNLDVLAEQAVKDFIFRSPDLTCIIIAHRLSTIRQCERIYVMKNGRVEEVGSHEELMEKRGVYYDMVQAQL